MSRVPPIAGYWNIIIHGRKHSSRLYTKMLNEAMRWANAIQGAIDSKVPIETPTQQLIRDIKVGLFAALGCSAFINALQWPDLNMFEKTKQKKPSFQSCESLAGTRCVRK